MSVKMIPYIIGGLALIGLGLIVNSWRLDSNRLTVVEKERDDAQATIVQIRTDAKTVADASAGYQTELASLRASRAAQPTTPVRLCRPAAAPAVRVSAAEPGPDGGAPAARVLPGGAGEDLEAGPDIGSDLRALADRADDINAQARGLQKAADDLAPQ